MIGIGVHGEGLVVVSILVQVQFPCTVIKTHGIVPVIQIICIHGFPLQSFSGGSAAQGHLAHSIHQVNLHFMRTGRPVFVNGIVLVVFPARIHGHGVVHLDAHGNFAGIAGHAHHALGNHLLGPARKRNGRGAAHDELFLPMVGVGRIHKVRGDHLAADIVQGGVFQTAQQAGWDIGNGEHRCLRNGCLGRENLVIYLVCGQFHTENRIAALAQIVVADMVGGRLGSSISRIEEEVYGGNHVLVIVVLAGLRAADTRLCEAGGFQAGYVQFNHGALPLRLLLCLLCTAGKQH